MATLFGCEEDYPRSCDDCPIEERKKIIHVAFVRSGVTIPTTSASALNTALLAAELACNAVIIRNVSGEYDGGTFVEGAGPGKQISRILGGTHNAIFTDFNYVGNESFWNAFKRKSQNYYMIYFTDTRAWVVPNALTVLPKPAFDRDNQGFIEADITVKWSSADNPVSYLADPDALNNCQVLFDFDTLDGFEQNSGDESTIDGTSISIDEDDNMNIYVDTEATIASVEVTSGTLPTGLTIEVSGTAILISGSPSVAGTYDLTIRASSACGVSGEFSITITVNA
jgi:hypothetical protein